MTNEFDIDIKYLDTGGATKQDLAFVEDALIKSGAEITDSGFGFGGADLGYRLNGIQYSLTLKRREKPKSVDLN